MAYLPSGTPELTISWEDSIRSSVDAARAYLRQQWGAFLGLSARIIDLQHRAAELAYRNREAHPFLADQAKAVIRELGKLNQYHNSAVAKMRTVASYTGLGAVAQPATLGAIPAAQVTVITALALFVVWFFRAFEAQERKLDLIESGALTPEQAAQLEPGPMPQGVISSVADILKWAAFAFLGYMALQALQGRELLPNPPLVTWDVNPPEGGLFGDDVYAIWYRHTDDGRNYVHEFDPGVELEALPDGSVLLSHPTRRLWEEF